MALFFYAILGIFIGATVSIVCIVISKENDDDKKRK